MARLFRFGRPVHSIDGMVIYASCLALVFLFVWLGLIGILQVFVRSGERDFVEFVWELVLFSFVLLAAAPVISASIVPNNSAVPAVLIFCFLLSVGCLLGGMGGAFFGMHNALAAAQFAGLSVFFFATVPLALGLSIMIVEMLKKAISSLS